MPHCDHPHVAALHSVEEAIRANDDLAVRKVGELGEMASRARKALEAAQNPLGALAKATGRFRIVPVDVEDDREKLSPSRRRKAYAHAYSESRISSASRRTASRVLPLPARISRSPRARAFRMRRCSSACS